MALDVEDREVPVRIALGVLLLVHALVHLLGFVAALHHGAAGDGAAEAGARRARGGPLAAVWLAAAVALGLGAVGLFADEAWWRTAGFLGVVFSSVALALWWKDAKYGAPLTAVVLLAVLVAPGVDSLP